MLKSKFFRITFFKTVFIAYLFNTLFLAKSFAQDRYLEFNFGGAINSAFNNGENGKKLSEVQLGTVAGVAYGYDLPFALLPPTINTFKIFGEIYYAGKGEKYRLKHTHEKIETSIYYGGFRPSLRFYIPPLEIMYVCIGNYFAVAANQTGDYKYKKFDYGNLLGFGIETGRDNVKVNVSLTYEHGLRNISKEKGINIRNRCLLLTVGASFRIVDKSYKHY